MTEQKPWRRPLGLLVILAVVLAVTLVLERVRAPVPSQISLLGVRPADVVALRVREGAREFRAVRQGDTWRVEVPPVAGSDAPAAVAEIVEVLTAIAPVDTVERGELNKQLFGFDPPRVRIEIGVRGKAWPMVLLLGDYVPTGGSVYGAVSSNRRLHQIGSLIMSEIEKAFYRIIPREGTAGQKGR